MMKTAFPPAAFGLQQREHTFVFVLLLTITNQRGVLFRLMVRAVVVVSPAGFANSNGPEEDQERETGDHTENDEDIPR